LESKLVAVDLFGKFWGNNNDYDHEKTFRENIAKSGKEKQVEIIKGDSFSALVKLNQEKKIEFDFIYIDGSHAACDVMSDAVLAWKLLKENGIMIFDDYE
jgi:predicted O-methyltransferase YrrM